jgi:hypothetical protein
LLAQHYFNVQYNWSALRQMWASLLAAISRGIVGALRNCDSTLFETFSTATTMDVTILPTVKSSRITGDYDYRDQHEGQQPLRLETEDVVLCVQPMPPNETTLGRPNPPPHTPVLATMAWSAFQTVLQTYKMVSFVWSNFWGTLHVFQGLFRRERGRGDAGGCAEGLVVEEEEERWVQAMRIRNPGTGTQADIFLDETSNEVRDFSRYSLCDPAHGCMCRDLLACVS